MLRVFSLPINILLILLIIAVTVFSIYKLRSTFYDFDTVKIQNIPQEVHEKADKIDQILYDSLPAFRHIRSFDHLLGKEQYNYHLNTVWIDRCEVRQGDFYKFIKWQKKNPDAQIAESGQPADWIYKSTSLEHKISGRIKAPANGVSYYDAYACLLYTSPSPRDRTRSRMPSSA